MKKTFLVIFAAILVCTSSYYMYRIHILPKRMIREIELLASKSDNGNMDSDPLFKQHQIRLILLYDGYLAQTQFVLLNIKPDSAESATLMSKLLEFGKEINCGAECELTVGPIFDDNDNELLQVSIIDYEKNLKKWAHSVERFDTTE